MGETLVSLIFIKIFMQRKETKIMELTFAPRDILQIDNAIIAFRNFKGEAGKFNHEGERNFAVVIPNEELANELTDRGWNVKIKPPREEGDTPFMYLQVKVKFNSRGPRVYLRFNDSVTALDEDTIGCIDDVSILNVNLDIRPYDWEVNGKTGRTAYLQSMEVTQDLDRFAAAYNGEHIAY